MRPQAERPAIPAHRFALRFIVAWLALLALPAALPGIGLAAIEAMCRSVLGALALAGHDPARAGDMIRVGPASVKIVADCTPLPAFAALSAAMLAYPASWRARLVGFAVALPLLWLFDLVRILASMFVLARARSLFDFTHDYLWQVVTLGVVLALFVGWMRVVDGRRVSAGHSQ